MVSVFSNINGAKIYEGFRIVKMMYEDIRSFKKNLTILRLAAE